MEKTFNLEIYASDHIFYTGKCEMVILPTVSGEQGILVGHQPMIVAIAVGELRYKIDNIWNFAAVSEGFAEIEQDKVIVISDTVERPDEIDRNRAKRAKEIAEEELRQKQSIMEYYHTQAALNRALNRMKINNRRR